MFKILSIKDYIFTAIIVALVGYGLTKHFIAESLKIDVKNGEDAIVAYESLLKVAPFEALNTERKEKADEEITYIINNDNYVTDGTYSL